MIEPVTDEHVDVPTMLEAALEYASRGMAVFPLRPKSKVPLTGNGLHAATVDETQIRTWWTMWPDANVAIATGPSKLVVLDVDPAHGGAESLVALRREIGDDAFVTATSSTGGGGEHYFFRAGSEALRNSAGVLGRGLDVRADGGYVVAPPSIHESSRRYTWAFDYELGDVPREIVRKLNNARAATPSIAPTTLIGEGSRNSRLASIAGTLRNCGLDADEIYAAIADVNTRRCRPPLDSREVRAIAESISRYEARSPIETANAKPADRERPEPLLENASIVSREPFEPIEYDVALILPAPDAPGLMFGPPGSFKSYIALALCDAIVRGSTFLGLETRQRARALYINLDAGAKTFRNRVRALSDAPGLDFVSMPASDFSAARIRSYLSGPYAGAFVVIDCLSSIYAPDPKKDPASSMRAFVDDLRSVFAEFDCGGLIIDHPHRPKERGDVGDYHGSIQKEAAFRTMWMVTAETVSDPAAPRRAKISHRKMSEGAPFAPIDAEIVFGSKVVVRRAVVTGDPNDRLAAIDAKISEWARAQIAAFSKTTVGKKVGGYRADDIRDGFDRLVATGAIVPTGAKRTRGELYRFAVEKLMSPDPGTHSDALGGLGIGTTKANESPYGSSIGDSLAGTDSPTPLNGDSNVSRQGSPVLVAASPAFDAHGRAEGEI